MNEFEQALNDLYTAIRYSSWNSLINGKPFLYEIDGTAEVIAVAVMSLVQKRRNKANCKGETLEQDEVK